MRKKELSPNQLLRMQKRAIKYRKRVRSRCLRASNACRMASAQKNPPRLLKRRLMQTAQRVRERIAPPIRFIKVLTPRRKALMQKLKTIPPRMKPLWEKRKALLQMMKRLWKKAAKILPHLMNLMRRLWKLLLFLQIPCRILILILEPLLQRIRRADWTPCEGS